MGRDISDDVEAFTGKELHVCTHLSMHIHIAIGDLFCVMYVTLLRLAVSHLHVSFQSLISLYTHYASHYIL